MSRSTWSRSAPERTEEYEAKADALLRALKDGEESGGPAPFDVEAFIREKRRGEAP